MLFFKKGRDVDLEITDWKRDIFLHFCVYMHNTLMPMFGWFERSSVNFFLVIQAAHTCEKIFIITSFFVKSIKACGQENVTKIHNQSLKRLETFVPKRHIKFVTYGAYNSFSNRDFNWTPLLAFFIVNSNSSVNLNQTFGN